MNEEMMCVYDLKFEVFNFTIKLLYMFFLENGQFGNES